MIMTLVITMIKVMIIIIVRAIITDNNRNDNNDTKDNWNIEKVRMMITTTVKQNDK